MYTDCYVLEVMAKTKLAELRADATRRRLLASLRAPRPGIWAVLRSWFNGEGRQNIRRKIVRPRHA